MKNIILIILAFLVIYYGMFNSDRPILLFCLFSSFAILLYLLLIRDKINVVNFRLLRKVRIKDFFTQVPICLITLIGILYIRFDYTDRILELFFIIFKVIVMIEFLTLFLIELSLMANIEEE